MEHLVVLPFTSRPSIPHTTLLTSLVTQYTFFTFFLPFLCNFFGLFLLISNLCATWMDFFSTSKMKQPQQQQQPQPQPQQGKRKLYSLEEKKEILKEYKKLKAEAKDTKLTFKKAAEHSRCKEWFLCNLVKNGTKPKAPKAQVAPKFSLELENWVKERLVNKKIVLKNIQAEAKLIRQRLLHESNNNSLTVSEKNFLNRHSFSKQWASNRKIKFVADLAKTSEPGKAIRNNLPKRLLDLKQAPFQPLARQEKSIPPKSNVKVAP